MFDCVPVAIADISFPLEQRTDEYFSEVPIVSYMRRLSEDEDSLLPRIKDLLMDVQNAVGGCGMLSSLGYFEPNDGLEQEEQPEQDS